MYANELL
jgi:seryl-tRNA synthetase